MKNTIITSAFVAILGLAFVGASSVASAQTTNAPASATAPSTAPKAKTKPAKTPYKGTITAIDASSVTLASKDKTLTLAITPKTTFKVDKVAATASQFAVGDTITGSYTTDSTGALSAASIHKKTTAAKPAPAATPATQ